MVDEVGGWGSVSGMSAKRAKLTCKNLSTDQEVTSEIFDTTWSCRQAGLNVNPGDTVKQQITVIGHVR